MVVARIQPSSRCMLEYAGSETDGLSVDYKAKYTGQMQAIKDNYATFR